MPRHFEACSLATWARWAGWPLAVVLLVVHLVRCRRYEIIVGRRTLGLSCGPYRHTVSLGSIEKGEARAAGGWRLLCADREPELVTRLGNRRFLVPTRDEHELRRGPGCG